jgi:hypothetical protein
MRRSITEYWSNQRVLWQQYSSSHSSQYRRRSYRLLANSQNQSSVQQLISLYEILSQTNVSANEIFRANSFGVCVDSSSEFSIFLFFSSHFLIFFLAYLTAIRSFEFDSRILLIFFLISSFDFHSVERIFSIRLITVFEQMFFVT